MAPFDLEGVAAVEVEVVVVDVLETILGDGAGEGGTELVGAGGGAEVPTKTGKGVKVV